MRRTLGVTLLCCTVSWACGGVRSTNGQAMQTTGEQAMQTTGGETVLRGIIRVVGAEPFSQAVIEMGEGATRQQVAVAGPLKDEVRKLSGIEASVVGPLVANTMGTPAQAIDAWAYRVISVDGEPGYMGVLRGGDGAMWLDGTSSMRLTAVPAELRQKPGAKVWVTGRMQGDVLSVQAYGIIREAGAGYR